jgi:hypothetical protein
MAELTTLEEKLATIDPPGEVAALAPRARSRVEGSVLELIS